MEFRLLNLTTVLEEVLVDLRAQLEATGTTVQYDSLPTVRSDPAQLHALFQNLLTNAVKYRHPDRSPAVQLRAMRAGHQWEIRVVDNGIGIVEHHHERIFQVFQRLHPEQKYEGVGIGLAVCKRIVERRGGNIRVESALGQGATFVFTLPCN